MPDYFSDPSFNEWLTTSWKTESAVDQSANIQMISPTQLLTLTTPDFTTLFSSSGQFYNYISSEQFSALGETQIPLLSPQAVAYFFSQDCFFSETQIHWLTTGTTYVNSSSASIDASNQLYKVSTKDIADRFVDLTAGQIQHLNYVDSSNNTYVYSEQLSKISALNVSQRWHDFAADEVKYLTGSGQLELLSGSDISNNHSTNLSRTQIQRLRNDQVNGWSNTSYFYQADNFTSGHVAYLIENDAPNFYLGTNNVISQLIGSSASSVNQFASASAVDISNIFQYMIPTQVPHLTYGSDGSIDQLADLGPVITSLTIPTAGSNDDKLVAFTPQQVAHMFGQFNGQMPTPVYPRGSKQYLSYTDPSSQLTSLNALQIWADFSSLSVSSLTTLQFQSLSYDNSGSQMDQLQGLTADQVANGTTFDSSNIFQILTPAQKRSLSDGSSAFNQLSALSATQVANFFPESSGAYYNRSSPINDASNGFTPSQIRHLTDVSGVVSINQLSDLTAAQVAACVDASGYLYFTLDQIRTLRYADSALELNQLSDISNASILNVNVTEFSAAQVQYFVSGGKFQSDADFQALTDGVNGSTYNQLEYLSAADVSNNISKLLPSQIPQLSCIGSGTTSSYLPTDPNVNSSGVAIGSQLRCLSPSQINTYWTSFSPMQIASLRADQLSALSAENIQSITQAQVFSIWSSLNQAQVQQLTWGQLDTINQLELLSGPQVALKISYFDPSQIPHLNNKPDCGIMQLAYLTADQIANTLLYHSISPSILVNLFTLFTIDQVQTLTYKPHGGQLFKLIATQVRDRWTDFTADQIQSFTPHQVTAVYPLDVQNSFLLFTPQQVAALSSPQLALKNAADVVIAAAAAAALAIQNDALAAAAALAASYITMTEVSFNQISATTFGLMQPEILYQIPSNLINSMSSAQIAGLTPEGIVAVSRYLTQPQVAGWAGYNVPATTPPSYPTALLNGTQLNFANPVYSDSSGTKIFYGDETSPVYTGISSEQITLICAIPATISGTPTQFYDNGQPIDGLTPQHTNFFTIKNLAPSFISYLTTDAFNAWESSVLAEFTQAQAMYITNQQYTLLAPSGDTTIEQKRLIINQILLNDITPINFDLVGLNTDAVAPLLFSDKLYEPKLGVYDAEVQVHMDIAAARKFIQYKFSSASDPYSVPSGDGNAGDVHLYLDKTQFLTGVNRGASLTDLSVGVTLEEYRAYDFSNNISAFTPDTPSTQYNLDWNGNVINCSMSKDPNVSMSVDMIQYIAQQTFGRWMAYNLFNDQESQNERLQLNINRAINHTIRPILDSYDMHTGTYMESPDDDDDIWPVRNTLHVQKYLDLSTNALDATHSAGVYYTKLDSVIDSSGIDQTAKSEESTNIPSCIFDIMYQNQPQRFKSQIHTNLFQRTTLNSNVTQTLMTMPFVQGDKLRFICTCNTDANQYTLDNTSGPPVSLTGIIPTPSTNMQIKPRRYLVSIVLDDICECPDEP
jgi:hypothetical protein